MNSSHLEYLQKNNFSKQLKRLEEKLATKSIIIYGAGVFFKEIVTNYNLRNLNIIAITDRSFSQEGTYLGYPTCTVKDIKIHNPDYILVGTLNYTDIIDELEQKLGKDIKIFPLVKKPIIDIWKEIWE